MIEIDLREYCQGLRGEKRGACLVEFDPAQESRRVNCMPGSLANGYRRRPMVEILIEARGGNIYVGCEGCVLNPEGFDRIVHGGN